MRSMSKRLLGLFALGLAAWASPALAQSVVRQPYLQVQTPTSITVAWTTDVATDSRVQFGSSPTNLTQSVVLSPLVTQHEVKLNNLTPNTRYYYSVGSTSTVLAGASSTFYFDTAPTVG